ncbi:MAG: transketolase [Bifidobacteriaceae bacterium]|nr:transketolase [Bifidobacteriaceae bacterium]
MTDSLTFTDLDRRAVAAAKALAADAVDKAGNGHPGTAISLAPAAYTLYQYLMRHDPADPAWPGRDRLVLSAGHSSLTLYVQLYLAGYGIEIDDLANLRQWDSLLPGHPEYRHTPGVEMTTGPLGQGLASAVGRAMAARRERGLFDPDAAPGTSPFDHTIWVIAGDGDLQEGVTAEASSLAGAQELGNLVVLYDANHISIEGDTDIAFTEDVLARYEAYGWHTQCVDWRQDGHYEEDVVALFDALRTAAATTSRPSIVALRTIIAWPAPTKQNTGGSHGSKLGAEETVGLKKALGLDPDRAFFVPPEVLDHARGARARGAAAHAEWETAIVGWRSRHPERAALWDRLQTGRLPDGWTDALPDFPAGTSVASRAASGTVLTALAGVLPELWGGSADLAGSNNTTMVGEPSFLPHPSGGPAWPGGPYGRTLHFGIREHAMGAILNGIRLHGPTRPYGGTFLVFSDYMRPPVRLAALMGIGPIFVWTHDSIGVGEDGPTHQPVEHLATLRAIPGFDVVRPADANEVAWAWKTAIERPDSPVGIILSRQNLPTLARTSGPGLDRDAADAVAPASGVVRGAYVLAEPPAGLGLDVALIATGSEVQHALGARTILAAEGIGARVISAPCLEWFAEQDEAYRESVLPAAVRARVSVEAGITVPWRALVGDAGRSIGIDTFGLPGDGNLVMRHFGFTPENVAAKARESIAAASTCGIGREV